MLRASSDNFIKSVLLSFGMCLLTMFATPSATAQLNSSLQQRLEAAIKEGRIQSAAVGLYDNGKTSFYGFGLTEKKGKPPTAKTVYEIGSISKVFTSLLLSDLIEQKKLKLEQTVGSMVPDLEVATSDIKRITLFELSTHASGLPRMPDNYSAESTDPFADYDELRLLSFLSNYETDKLTKQYEYSNLGAGLLGYLAAKKNDLSYPQAIEQRITKPLGLDSTYVPTVGQSDDNLAPPHSDSVVTDNWYFDALAGAGAIRSNVDDMLRFIKANLHPAETSISGVLERALTSQSITKQAMGLGWHIDTLNEDETYVWHNGGTGGYASMLAIFPKRNSGIVILTNSTEFQEVTNLAQVQFSDVGDVANIDLAPYLGAYELAPGFVVTITESANQLYAQATGQGKFPIYHDKDNRFVYKAVKAAIEFDTDDNGQVNKMTLFQGGQELVAKRVADEKGIQSYDQIEVAPDTFDQYLGQYQLAPGVIIKITRRGDNLFAQLTGQGALPIFPYDEDKFFYRAVDAQYTFERGKDGSVSRVVLHQNGKNQVARKNSD